MPPQRKNRIPPVLTLTVAALAVFAIGFALRLAAQRYVAPTIVVNPVEVALAGELPTPVATPPERIEAEAGKVAQISPAGGQLLFNSEIQSHLENVADAKRVNDVEMTVSDFYQSNGHLYVGVCFEGQGVEGWQMGPATLAFANGEASRFAVHPTLDERGGSVGETGRHCETLEFDALPAVADLSKVSLRVESVLLAYPEEFKECDAYGARWELSVRMKELGVVAECSQEAGYINFILLSKPEGMTEEEALTIAGQEAMGMVIGPWIFEDVKLIVEE